MLTPTGITKATYIAAVKNHAQHHVRLTFVTQNIVLNDIDLEFNGIHITDYMNSDTDLVMGKAVMRQLSVGIMNKEKVADIDWTDNLKVEIGIDINGTTNWLTIGYFNGKKPEKIQFVDIIDFIAYDRMKKFDVLADDWLSSLTYPMTLSQMYSSLCTYCGVSKVSGNELSSIMSRSFSSAPIIRKGVMCRTILAAIAEACGCYAKINASGYCQMVWFSDHTDYELTLDDEFSATAMDIKLNSTWADLESYTWAQLESRRWDKLGGNVSDMAINGLSVKQTDDDIGVTVPANPGSNLYVIVDNPFLVTNNASEVTAYIQPIYDRLSAFGGYIPAEVTAIGNALIETGDIITVSLRGVQISLPIFTKDMQCNSSCTDVYEATGSLERETYTTETREKLSEGGRYHIYKNTVDELYSELYDQTTGDITILNQQVNSIELYAEKKARVYYQSNQPYGSQDDPLETGDLWIKTDDGNRMRRYNGTVWEDVSDANKYSIVSSISIIPEGIDISGGHYVRIFSGDLKDHWQYNILGLMYYKTYVDEHGQPYQSPKPIMQFGYDADRLSTVSSGIYIGENSNPTGDSLKQFLRFYLSGTHGYSLILDNRFIGQQTSEATLNLRPSVTMKGSLGDAQFVWTNGYINNVNSTYIFPLSGDQSGYLGESTSRWLHAFINNVHSGSIVSYAHETGNIGYSDSRFLHVWSNNIHSAYVYSLSNGSGSIGGTDLQWYEGWIQYVHCIDCYQSSSRDVKHGIEPMEDVGERIDALQPVTFIYDNDPDEKRRYGLIYEDTVDVLPEICTLDESQKEISYLNLVPMLLQEVKSLRRRVKELEETEMN